MSSISIRKIVPNPEKKKSKKSENKKKKKIQDMQGKERGG
jgi:hypothetical protein